jgi:hypothetical protein
LVAQINQPCDRLLSLLRGDTRDVARLGFEPLTRNTIGVNGQHAARDDHEAHQRDERMNRKRDRLRKAAVLKVDVDGRRGDQHSTQRPVQ